MGFINTTRPCELRCKVYGLQGVYLLLTYVIHLCILSVVVFHHVSVIKLERDFNVFTNRWSELQKNRIFQETQTIDKNHFKMVCIDVKNKDWYITRFHIQLDLICDIHYNGVGVGVYLKEYLYVTISIFILGFIFCYNRINVLFGKNFACIKLLCDCSKKLHI